MLPRTEPGIFCKQSRGSIAGFRVGPNIRQSELVASGSRLVWAAHLCLLIGLHCCCFLESKKEKGRRKKKWGGEEIAELEHWRVGRAEAGVSSGRGAASGVRRSGAGTNRVTLPPQVPFRTYKLTL